MKINDNELKSLYRSYLQDKIPSTRKNCPPTGEILHFFRKPSSKKGKIIDHITSCRYCLEEFEFILQTFRGKSKLTEELDSLMKDPKKEDAARMKRITLLSPRFLWRSVFVSLSAALLVFLVIAVFFTHQLQISLKRENRGKIFGQVSIISPQGENPSAKPLIFRWSESKNVDHYLVELFDEALVPVWKSPETSLNQVELPPSILNRLKKKRPYFWMVTVFLEKGGRMESGLAQFTLRD